MCYLCNRNRERCFLEIRNVAEIAQLVEHNLAKVGVAGPSPVFRSHILNISAQNRTRTCTPLGTRT